MGDPGSERSWAEARDLGSLVSGFEYLRTRALTLMQEDPRRPVDAADRAMFDALLESCAIRLGPTDPVLGEVGPLPEDADVATLHRLAGMLERACEVRLAAIRSGRGRPADP